LFELFEEEFIFIIGLGILLILLQTNLMIKFNWYKNFIIEQINLLLNNILIIFLITYIIFSFNKQFRYLLYSNKKYKNSYKFYKSIKDEGFPAV